MSGLLPQDECRELSRMVNEIDVRRLPAPLLRGLEVDDGSQDMYGPPDLASELVKPYEVGNAPVEARRRAD